MSPSPDITRPLEPISANETGLRVKRLGIDAYQENIVYLHADSDVCKSEGFKALTRVVVRFGEKTIVATLNVLRSGLLGTEEASLSEAAFERLGIHTGDRIEITHLEPLASLAYVRRKIFGRRLSSEAYFAIIHDIGGGKYSNVQLAAFVAACSGKGRMTVDEITSLAKAMISEGEILHWPGRQVMDKHCIGGLPGNRTTPIVVAIAAAAGVCIPKTSSRAITSPAGTADVMEVMTNVSLSLVEIQAVVNKEGACLAWGGEVKLSPVDDILIRVERALDIDSEAQLIASVLSKKAAAGSQYIVIDVPVGSTAKIRSWEQARTLKTHLLKVAAALELKVKVLLTDGSQPVGRGIGPALEAMDVLAVLRNGEDAPADLAERSITLAGTLLETAGLSTPGKGTEMAWEILRSGKALEKFYAICRAQGRFTEPAAAPFTRACLAKNDGTLLQIDNRKLARAAKLAGAPMDKTAGVKLYVKLGARICAGQTLMTLYAESEGSLQYAMDYIEQHSDILKIGNGHI